MKYQPLINSIVNSVNDARILATFNKEILSKKPGEAKNEFLFFVKPEITLNSKQIKLDEILRLIFEKLDEFDFHKKSIRIINAKYLKKHKIINQHYGVISKLSSELRNTISDSAKKVFEKEYGVSFVNANILGSIEFLKKHSFFSPMALSMLWQNSAFTKLAGGTYVQKLSFDGDDIFLVNGFHPRQLEHFTTPGRCIIAMTLVSDCDWVVARNKLIGKTNPAEAEKGSVRNELLLKRDSFGLKNISSSWNGVHLSAGPIEALIELMRYNSDFDSAKISTISDFQFGKQLINEFGEEKTLLLLENPSVNFNNKLEPIFDLTEEMNSDTCIELLKKIKI